MASTGSRASIERLISEMTLAEKVGQLTMVSGELVQTGPTSATLRPQAIREGRIGSLLNLFGAERVRAVQRIAVEESRLKIPLFFSLDVVHGLDTLFPIPLGETCAFDPSLWERTARAAAEEAAAAGIDLTFAPMIDVARDPRWGRVVEGPGEDSLVASRFAAAKVRGFQSRDIAGATVIGATAKHLAGYGAVQAGREYASVDITERQLREIYLPPFRAAVEAEVAAIMPAFTDLDGTPMTANAAILRGIVRGEWGFSGVMISDYGAVAELVMHGSARDQAEAAALALNAGVDIDMMGRGAYSEGLPLALKRGLVTLALIEEAVRRVLELKAKLGLFEDPYRRCGAAATEHKGGSSRERRDLAREAARRSLVLLSNRHGALPLRDGGAIAVIGPLADGRGSVPEPADGIAAQAIAVLDGLRDALPHAAISFAQGCGVERIDESGKASAQELARRSGVIVLCLGETPAMSGEAASRGRPDLPHAQAELARAMIGLGKPLVVLLFCGRPLILPDWLVEGADALLAAWFPGSEAQRAIADVLSGRHDPGGRLSMSWPVDVGQIPIFFGERPTGRPAAVSEHYSSKYLDLPVEPRFSFGHGLSYGGFGLSGLRVDRSEMRAGEAIEVEVDVSNTGPMAGEETVFLFVRDLFASVTRPLLELKDFGKIALAPGERDTLRFRLAAEDLRFLGRDLAPRLEPGAFDLFVGRSAARDALLSTRIELLG